MTTRPKKRQITDKDGAKINKKTTDFLEGLVGVPTFARTLKSIRLSKELTQREFGEKLGISTQLVSDLENERKGVSSAKARDFAIKLGHKPEYFVKLVVQDMLAKEGMHWEIVGFRKRPKRAKAIKSRPVVR